MTSYETSITNIFHFLSKILNDYFFISKKMKTNQKWASEEFDKAEEAFCRAIDDLCRDFEPKFDLEDIKHLNEEIEYIGNYWIKAQQNLESVKKELSVEFVRKFEIARTYMTIIENKICAYDENHSEYKLLTLQKVMEGIRYSGKV